ncbi:MAG TPA: hypothetical protein GX011_07705 [Clostridiales bacterium]|nr:hypothetical protein [Clostridiales bacterium]
MDRLKASISGSGDLDARKLTVREAEFEVRGSAGITVGRIIEKSVEKISKGASLKVLKRG